MPNSLEKSLEQLVKEAKRAANLVKSYQDPIRIFSHYDTDGITSAAIMTKALFREGKSFHLTAVKQLNKSFIDELNKCREELIIFLDFGSGQLKFLSELKNKKLIIIDHHQPNGEKKDFIIHVNPVDFGINENISSSGVSYIFSRALGQANKDLSELAVIGAIGDSQMGSIGENWGLMGLNKELLKDAEDSKKLKASKGLRIWGRTTRPIHKALEYCLDPYIPNVTGSESNSIQFLQELNIELKDANGKWRTLSDLTDEEQKKLASGIIIERVKKDHENPDWIFGDIYELLDRGEYNDANEFATMVNACGKLGEADLGISFCMNDQTAYTKVKRLLEKYRRTLGSGLNLIHKEKDKIMRETSKAIYFLVGNKISEHIISNVISIISKNWDLDKPIFGLADAEEGIKISARASDALVTAGINLKEILSKTAGELEGEGGGHKGASGATIPKGTEEEFIRKVDALIPESTLLKAKKILEAPKPEKPEQKELGSQKTDIQNNINPKSQEVDNEKADIGAIGQEAEREGSSQKDPREERGAAQIRRKKMEGKGLVRYFGS